MKSLPYFVAGLLLVSSLAAVGIGEEAGESETINIAFLEPNIKKINVEQENYIDILQIRALILLILHDQAF